MELERKIDLLNVIGMFEEITRNLATEFQNDMCEDTINFIQQLIESEEIPGYMIEMFQQMLLLMERRNWEDIIGIIKETKEILLENKKIIFFLPYKADMWDSMDSVYRGLIESENLLVAVMPIPYFLKDQSGQIIEEIYEGDQFPQDIPIIYYSGVNLESVKPDAIIIHNPYDQFNKVTIVAEEYFSKKLIQATEKLVYIPYFIAELDKDLIQYHLPSLSRAWRIITQSDIINQYYSSNSYINKNQLLPLGSPKIDYVLNRTKDNLNIPEEWVRICKDKKVLFLNTHINDLIGNFDDFILYMKTILFSMKMDKDLAVIWRPHPLSEQSIAAIKAHKLLEYQNIINEFNKMENGIFDTTSSMHEGIYLSDAYIGSESSLVLIYALTGKPILVLPKSNSGNMRISNGCIVKNQLYAIPEGSNHIISYDRIKQTFKLEKMLNLQEQKQDRYNMFATSICYENQICFIPNRSSEIIIYDISSKNLERIALPDSIKPDLENKFIDVIKHESNLWLIPGKANIIISLDMITRKLVCYDQWPNGVFLSEDNINFISGTIVEDQLWLCPYESRSLISLELTSGIMKNHGHEFGDLQYCGMFFDGTGFWFTPCQADHVLYWNHSMKEKTKFDKFPIGFALERGDRRFCRAYRKGEFIWMLPHHANKIVRLNINNGSMDEVGDLPQNYIGEVNNYAKYSGAQIYQDEIIIFTWFVDKILNIRLDTLQTSCDTLYFNNYIEENINHYVNKIVENDGNDYIKRDYYIKCLANADGTAGEKIADYLLHSII